STAASWAISNRSAARATKAAASCSTNGWRWMRSCGRWSTARRPGRRRHELVRAGLAAGRCLPGLQAGGRAAEDPDVRAGAGRRLLAAGALAGLADGVRTVL